MSEPTQPQSPAHYLRVRRYLPFIGLLLLVWVLSRFDAQALLAAWRRVSALAVAQAALLFALNLVLKAFRWQRMLVAQDIPLPLPVVLAAFFNAQFYGQVTLGRLGELIRAEALVEGGVPLGKALSSSLYDRLIDLLVVLALATVLGAAVVSDATTAMLAGAGLCAMIFLGVAVVRAKALLTLAPVVKIRAAIAARSTSRGALSVLASLVEGLGPLLRPRFLLEATLWTIAAWSCYFASLWQLAAGMGLSVTPTLLTAAASLGALSALLPVTISGIGAREVIFMHALALEQVRGEHAVVLSLLHLSMMMAVTIVFGLLGVLMRHRQHRVERFQGP